MDKTFDISPREAEEIKQEIQRCLDEMKLSFERMDKMQVNTAQSRERTRALLDNLKTHRCFNNFLISCGLSYF